ncbi:MAG: hypothetical protein ACNYWU_04485 [Desulfobacterales bacterium]
MVTAIDENTRRFSRLKFKILDDVSHLEELSKLVEAALTRECVALADKIEAQKADLSQEESEHLDVWHKIDFLRLQEDFPRLQRYAMFTTAMAAVEANVVALCYVLKENIGLTVEFKKSQSNIISNALKYLEKQAMVDMIRLSHDIKNIDMFRRIRNCIVHSEGTNTDSVPEEIRDYCNRIPTLCIDDQNRIILSEGFVSIALHIIRQFFNGLLESSKKAWKAQPSAALDRRSRAALD